MLQGQWLAVDDSGKAFVILDADFIGGRYVATGFLTRYTVPDSRVLQVNFEFGEDLAARNFAVPAVSIRAMGPPNYGAQSLSAYEDEFTSIRNVQLVGELVEGKLRLRGNADTGQCITAHLQRSAAHKPSVLRPNVDVNNWKTFTEYISAKKIGKFLYRGQSSSKRLRTTFHRGGRSNLIHYLGENIDQTLMYLSSHLKHRYVRGGNDNGPILALLQHHGYPTPLLDWTYSPYVAAFFAYRNVRQRRVEDTETAKVRMFVFDLEAWLQTHYGLPVFEPGIPHLSPSAVPHLENPRLFPQQGISTVTNMDDIETFIQAEELLHKRTFLEVIDLPAAVRPDVYEQLRLMGITAGSLFPGIDGLCEALKEEHFPLLKST